VAHDVPPHVVARADQELAAVEHLLDWLIVRWRDRQPEFDADGLDYVGRVGAFMHDIYAATMPYSPHAPYATLAVLSTAVTRLARRKP